MQGGECRSSLLPGVMDRPRDLMRKHLSGIYAELVLQLLSVSPQQVTVTVH